MNNQHGFLALEVDFGEVSPSSPQLYLIKSSRFLLYVKSWRWP